MVNYQDDTITQEVPFGKFFFWLIVPFLSARLFVIEQFPARLLR